jgi:hypothetical protein
MQSMSDRPVVPSVPVQSRIRGFVAVFSTRSVQIQSASTFSLPLPKLVTVVERRRVPPNGSINFFSPMFGRGRGENARIVA